MFNKSIGVELGVSYLMGGKTKATETEIDDKYVTTLSAKMIRIIPSLIISPGFEKINPYAKFGVVLGSGSINFESKEDDGGDITEIKSKANGGLAIGLNAGVGVNFNVSDNVALFGEVNMINLSYSPTKAELTKANFNGQDVLKDLDTSEKKYVFVDSYTESNNTTPDNTKPSESLKEKYPFGSIGLNFGVRFTF